MTSWRGRSAPGVGDRIHVELTIGARDQLSYACPGWGEEGINTEGMSGGCGCRGGPGIRREKIGGFGKNRRGT